MGDFLDKAKDAASKHGDKVDEGIERGGDFVDEKTGDKYSKQVDTGQEKAGDVLRGEDEQNPQ